MKEKQWFVVEEDTDIFNVFNVADFDEDGYLANHKGEEGYHISDFDVVYESNRYENCERWIDERQ